MKKPLDPTPYPQDPRSAPISGATADGSYVYVQDTNGIVRVLPDGQHVHPKVLGGAQPAKYAGDLTIRNGKVIDLTNLSGTFQFDEDEGLREVAARIKAQGMNIEPGAVRLFPLDGSRPMILE